MEVGLVARAEVSHMSVRNSSAIVAAFFVWPEAVSIRLDKRISFCFSSSHSDVFSEVSYTPVCFMQ